MNTGRNFDEILRVIDSLQLTANHRLATPVNWQPGEDCIIPPSISNDEAMTMFPAGWRALKPYLRYVAQPEPHVRYKKTAIATFDVPVDTVFHYMCSGEHPHKAFKSHRVTSVAGDVVQVEAEIDNPDGTTTRTQIRHQLSRPAASRRR